MFRLATIRFVTDRRTDSQTERQTTVSWQ